MSREVSCSCKPPACRMSRRQRNQHLHPKREGQQSCHSHQRNQAGIAIRASARVEVVLQSGVVKIMPGTEIYGSRSSFFCAVEVSGSAGHRVYIHTVGRRHCRDSIPCLTTLTICLRSHFNLRPVHLCGKTIERVSSTGFLSILRDVLRPSCVIEVHETAVIAP